MSIENFSGGVRRFFHDDGYETARLQARYVFNDFGGRKAKASNNKLHFASCRYLDEGMGRLGGQRENVAKVVATSLEYMMAWLKDHARQEGMDWSWCSPCAKKLARTKR